MKKSLFCTFFGSALFFLFSGVHANTPQQKAAEVGVKKCIPVIEKISSYVIRNSAHSFDYIRNEKNVDQRMLSFFVSRSYSDGESQVSMHFAPNLLGGCDGIYTETFVVEGQCGVVREDFFKKFNYRSSLNKKTIVLENDNRNIDVFLTPAGIKSDLCLITRREIVYP